MTDTTTIAREAIGSGMITVPLTSLALIAVQGEDAGAFLQGQFSNDVDAATDTACQHHAYCTPKGRMLAFIRLIRRAEEFRLIVPQGLAESLTRRLKMYVLRAKVHIAPAEESLLGVIDGSGAALPGVEVGGVLPRRLLLGETAPPAAARDSDDLWRLMDILSGIPQVYPDTAEEFIPQMVNLDLTDGVSFTKGCYPGQEIIVRLRHLGKLKQRMIAAEVAGGEAIAPGTPLYNPERPANKAGLVVDAVRCGDRCFISATAPASHLEEGALHVGAADGPPLQRLPLPYPVSAAQL